MKSSAHWTVAEPPAEQVAALERALGVSSLMAAVLVNRGLVEPEGARSFLAPRLRDLADPFAIGGLRESATRLRRALARRERLVLFSDYDADGLTAHALLSRALRQLGGEPGSFLPQRVAEGYGLTQEAARRCWQETRPELVVALDCGTTAEGPIRWLAEQGVETVVVDHHAGGRPPCALCVNPQLARAGSGAAGAGLASVGLAFKLLHGVVKLGRSEGDAGAAGLDLRALLPFAAVGTVTDLVPLRGENRILVAHGLSLWGEMAGPGLCRLAEASGVRGVPAAGDIAFGLGPRLNAAGRMADPRTALELLLTGDAARAAELARDLDALNQQRRATEQRMVEEARRQVLATEQQAAPFLVVAAEGWHEGVVGIVAARLARLFHRPAVVIALRADGLGRGSARSIDGVDLVAALEDVAAHLEAYGGHARAAGLTVRAEKVAAVRQGLARWGAAHIAPGQLRREQVADVALPIERAETALARELVRLEPCGEGVPRPLLFSSAVRLEGPLREFGDGHVRLKALLPGGGHVNVVGFRMADREIGGVMDLLYELRLDRWQGAEAAELVLRDLREAREP